MRGSKERNRSRKQFISVQVVISRKYFEEARLFYYEVSFVTVGFHVRYRKDGNDGLVEESCKERLAKTMANNAN